jgi:secretion/DNA translocation related CpaE-like protein
VVNANRPVAFVSDETLLDDLLKLAIAASCELELVPDAAAARQCWSSAPLVLLDPAGVRECAAESLPARRAVVVVANDPGPPDVWKQAMEVGAQRVVLLPGSEAWLVNLLADATEGPANNAGKVLAVIGARGGAGASVFAASVGLTVMKAGGNALLVDCDRRGGGLDLVIGAEAEAGLRWPEINLNGRVAANSLHDSLPVRKHGDGRLTLLSGARKGEDPPPDAVAAVVEAGRRAGEVVICDVPRHLQATALTAIDLADLTVIVMPAELRACIAADLLAKELSERGDTPQLIIRGPSPGGLRLKEIAASTDFPVLTTMSPEPHLAQSLERGRFVPRPKGPLSRAAHKVLKELSVLPPKPRRSEPVLRAVS